MKRYLPLLSGLIVVAGAAVVQGMWTQRWQPSAELEAAVRRLDGAPGDLGSWKAETATLEADALAAAGARGSWVRRYTDARTGASVLVVLLCGRSGQMSVHRPEHCYSGAGYEMIAEPTRCRAVVDPAAECWTTKFRKDGPTGDVQLRIFWTWFGDGAWQAPDSPRMTFAHLPALYKLYVVRELPLRSDRAEKDPSLDLLQQLLPTLAAALSRP